MNGETHGYDVSVGYTFGFVAEMAPNWLDLCARLSGHVASPRPSGARYLELGAGQGFNLCLLAAANPDISFVGVDLQAEHVAHATDLAAAASLTNVRFVEGDLIALAEAWPADFGTFDYVALHGVYTWVSAAVRTAIVHCLFQATHSGSLVYCGYNTQPGWLGAMPFQHLTATLRDEAGVSGGVAFERSIALLDRLRAGGANTFQVLPGLVTKLDAARGRTPNYLVHEYLHAGWQPLWHSQVANDFTTAGLAYLAPATVAETLLPEVLPPPLRAEVIAQPAGLLRQDVQDFIVNQSFRRDIFVRGHGGEAAPDLATRDFRAVDGTLIHLLDAPAAGRDVVVETVFGAVALQPPAYVALVEALAAGPQTIGMLAALPAMRAQGHDNAVRVMLLLLQARVVAIGSPHTASPATAQALNAAIAHAAITGVPYGHLAAAATGAAIVASETDLALLAAWLGAPDGDAARLANSVSGSPAQERLARATAFLEREIPRWRRLGVLD